jgi:hypothetical protein
MVRELNLDEGKTLVITFTDEGIVYDLVDKDGEVEVEYGYDLYEDVLPKQYKHI